MVTGFVVTGAVGVGLVVTGTGTGIGGTGRFFVVVAAAWSSGRTTRCRRSSRFPTSLFPTTRPRLVPDGSEPFVLLSPGVTVWLSGVDTGVSCPLTWPDVSPCRRRGVRRPAACSAAAAPAADGCSVGAGSLDAGRGGAVEGVVGVWPSADVVVPSATAGRPNEVVAGSPSDA